MTSTAAINVPDAGKPTTSADQYIVLEKQVFLVIQECKTHTK